MNDRDTFSKITNDFSSYQLNLDFQSVFASRFLPCTVITWWDALADTLVFWVYFDSWVESSGKK